MCCHLYYSARLLICQPDWNIFFKPVYHLNPFGNKFIFWWLIAVVFKMVLTFYNCICFSHKISPLCIKLYENMLVQYAYLSPTPHKGNRQTTVSCTVSRELHPLHGSHAAAQCSDAFKTGVSLYFPAIVAVSVAIRYFIDGFIARLWELKSPDTDK